MLKSLLVAVDGSEYSRGALDCVGVLAGASEPRCTLLHVIDVVSLEGPFLADLATGVSVSDAVDLPGGAAALALARAAATAAPRALS